MPEKLPKGWVKTKLGEVCSPVETIRPEDSPHTEFTYFDIGGIDNERNRIAETKTLTGQNVPSRARQAVRKDDILFSTVRTYLRKIARVEHDYPNPVASTGFTVIRPAEGVSSQFLFFQILSEDFLEPLHALQTGTSYPAVRNRDVFAQPIVLAPAREQQRIAAKLDAALSRIANGEKAAHRALQKLEGHRAAVLHTAVTGELTRAWRKAHLKNKKTKLETGEALLQRLLAARRTRWEETELRRLRSVGKDPKDGKWKSRYPEPTPPRTDDLPNLPKGWIWASLDQIGELNRGKSKHRPRDDTRLYGGPYPFIQTGDIRKSGGTIREHTQTYSEFGLKQSRLWPTGTLCITIAANIAETGILSYPACFPDSVVGFVQDDTLLKVRFVEFFIRSEKSELERYAPATAQKNINLELLKGLSIPLPPFAEQSEIVREVERHLSAADKLAAALEQQLARSYATRQSLLREAFAGRLVTQNPDDEPASVLLVRIRAEKIQKAAEGKLVRQLQPTKKKGSDSMQEQLPSLESLSVAWDRMGRKVDARRLFEEAGFGPDHVVQFYEALRATPEIRAAFQEKVQRHYHLQKLTRQPREKHGEPRGRLRLIELWLEDFKNLKDYTVRFDPAYGLDVVLGWNGTGKSNLFEALVIIFRDLHEWWEKNRWPDKPMSGYRLSYEIDQHEVEITWQPGSMKRPVLKKGPLARKAKDRIGLEPIKREQLPLPRFVFGYYSGPTNRLAEHFLPMKQAHYVRLREAKADDPRTLAELLEQRRFFCAETHHAKYVLLAFSYKRDPKISEFLKDRLRILGFESALFIIRKPRWAKPKSKAEDFWGATGIMRRVMERLRRYAIAPMVLEQTVSYGYRSTTEDHYYFFLPDIESLHSFAAEYQDARTFFLALESTDFSELIHDVMIQVRIKATNTEQVPITFHQLSEGEQQLLMVLGLMRFTKSHQSLVLLDEPDTHLNPHWSVEYIRDLTRVMSDNALESPEQQSSQILMATHDPLVITSLLKEQIHILNRDPKTGACRWTPASVNPRGLGYTGILTSEMFGFRSDLDAETLADLDKRVRLVAKKGSLTAREEEQLERIDKRLADAGFSKAFSDPYYAAFVRAWGRRYSDLMAGDQFMTPEKKQEVDRIAREVLREAVAEVEKEVAG